MKQIERIRKMEAILDRSTLALEQMKRAWEDYQKIEEEWKELEAYYESSLWRKDFDDDQNHKLPENLKRGVLSEDGIWNILEEKDALLEEMKKFLSSHMEKSEQEEKK